MSLVPLLRLAGVRERIAYTGCGLAVLVFLLLPWRTIEAIFGELAMDFTTWIVSGLLIVGGQGFLFWALWTTGRRPSAVPAVPGTLGREAA